MFWCPACLPTARNTPTQSNLWYDLARASGEQTRGRNTLDIEACSQDACTTCRGMKQSRKVKRMRNRHLVGLVRTLVEHVCAYVCESVYSGVFVFVGE